MAKKYIYSTLTSSVTYPTFVAGGADLPVATNEITIHGGANLPDKFLRTPEGAVVTPVTDEELDALQKSPVFQLHVKNGFLKVSDKKVEGEVAAADMEGRDKSAPLVDADFKEDDVQVASKNPRRA